MTKPDSRKKRRDDIDVERICAELLDEEVRISAREVARRANVAPSSITRDPTRKSCVDAARGKQKQMLKWVERRKKQSEKILVEQLADRDERIKELLQRVDLLVESHRAMILAVGELGGMAAWRRFFEDWIETEKKLLAMKAMPDPDERGNVSSDFMEDRDQPPPQEREDMF